MLTHFRRISKKFETRIARQRALRARHGARQSLAKNRGRASPVNRDQCYLTRARLCQTLLVAWPATPSACIASRPKCKICLGSPGFVVKTKPRSPAMQNMFHIPLGRFAFGFVGLQPTVIASRAPHLLLEQVHRPSTFGLQPD